MVIGNHANQLSHSKQANILSHIPNEVDKYTVSVLYELCKNTINQKSSFLYSETMWQFIVTMLISENVYGQLNCQLNEIDFDLMNCCQ